MHMQLKSTTQQEKVTTTTIVTDFKLWIQEFSKMWREIGFWVRSILEIGMESTESNFLRLVAAVYGPGHCAVRSYFDTCFPPDLLNTQLTTVLRLKLEDLKQKKVINIAQWNALFPSQDQASSVNFDVPLMICLLRNFHIKQQPVKGFDELPPDYDQSSADDLARVKFYRNYVAHSSEGKINQSEFTTAWNNLCGAIERLGGATLKEQCESLSRTDLNLAYKSLCHELMQNISKLQTQDELLESRHELIAKDLAEHMSISKQSEALMQQIMRDIQLKHELICIRLEENKKQLLNQLENVSKLSELNRSSIPRNIRGMHNRQIKTWIKEDGKYVSIKATNVVLKLVDKEDCITVVGNGGTGKTALIRHVALVLLGRGHEIIPVNEPSKIQEYYDENTKQVFVFDDACGIHTVDHRKRIEWKDYCNIIKDNLKFSKAKLLISARLTVSNDKQFKTVSLLNENIVNLNEQDLSLSKADRVNIFKSYFEKDYVTFGISDKSFLAHKQFPLVCRLAAYSMKQTTDLNQQSPGVGFDLDKYFKAPDDVYLSEIGSLQMDSPLSYCVLVLCTLFNGRLPRAVLCNSEYKRLVEDCCESCCLNRGTSRKELLEQFSCLENVYLKSDETDIVFVHDLIMDIVARYICNESPKLVLSYSSAEFIRDRVKLVFETCLLANAEPHTMGLSKQYHTLFFDRLYRDIRNGHSYFVFNHSQIKSNQFQKAMSEYLKTKELSELKSTLFCAQETVPPRHILHIIDMYTLFLQNKPLKTDIHDLLQCFVKNAFHWILGKGLNVILKTLYNLIGKVVLDEIKNNLFYRYLIILGGNVELFSWYKEIMSKNKTILVRVFDCFRDNNEHVKIDLLLTILTGNNDLLSLIWEQNPSAMHIKDDTVYYRLLVLIGVMDGWSLSVAKTFVSLLKFTNVFITCPSGTTSDYTGLMESIMYNYWLTEDPKVNKVLITKFVFEIKPLLERNMKQLKTIYEGLSYTPSLNSVFRCQLYTRRSYLEMASELGHRLVVKSLLSKTESNYACIQKCVVSKHLSSYPIVFAAMNGQTQIVNLLLQHGALIDSCSASGCSSLHLASSYGHLGTVALLLENGASVNLQNSLSNTALIYASKKGHKDIAALLLKYGSDPNIKCRYGTTALLKAAKNGRCEIVDLLLKNNALVNAVDKRGFSALMKAVQGDFHQVVQILISFKASTELRSKEGKTALVIAAENECLKSMNIILENEAFEINEGEVIEATRPSDIDFDSNMYLLSQLPFCSVITGQYLTDALLAAFQKRNIDSMKVLLLKGADADCCDSYGWPLLCEASYNGEFDIVSLLIQHDANVNIRAGDGSTPLIYASKNGHNNIVKFLIANRANINTRSNHEIDLSLNRSKLFSPDWIGTDTKCSALMVATIYRHTETVRMLLNEKTTDINSRTEKGFTALIIAVVFNNQELVKLLINHGVNVNIKSFSGYSALEVALVEGFFEIARLLIEKNAHTRFFKSRILGERIKSMYEHFLPMSLEVATLRVAQNYHKLSDSRYVCFWFLLGLISFFFQWYFSYCILYKMFKIL